MNNEITKTETNLPAEVNYAWGNENIDNDDIVLPKLLLMQGMSELVSEKELAEAGDIVKSTTETILGNRDEPVKIIPISVFKTWVLSMKEGTKFKFKSVEPMNSFNAVRPLEWMDEAGNDWRADKALNFYVLLQSEVKGSLAGEGVALPCLVSFRRTSYMAGRKLASGMNESKFMKQPGAARVYDLKVTKQTNDIGTWFAFDLAPAGKSSLEEVMLAKQWFDTLSSGAVKIHEAGDEE